MAEFCNKCAKEHGLYPDRYPLLCEGCGNYFEKTNLITQIKNKMKKLLFLTVLLSTAVSFAQLEVKEDNSELIGEIAPMGQMSAEIIKSGENYIFTYRDMKYTQITEFKSFSFQSFDNLYNFLIDGMNDKRKDQETITLDGVDLIIDFTRSFGKGSVRLYHSENGVNGLTRWFTEKQVDKLFGK